MTADIKNESQILCKPAIKILLKRTGALWKTVMSATNSMTGINIQNQE